MNKIFKISFTFLLVFASTFSILTIIKPISPSAGELQLIETSEKNFSQGFDVGVSTPFALFSDTPTPTPTPSKTSNTARLPQNDPALWTVDKYHSIGSYTPNDLITFDRVRVSTRISNDLSKLIDAANKDGVTLKVVSGYRSYQDQVYTFDSWVNVEMRGNPGLTREQAEERANHYSARPGYSEHQLGTTVDILSSETNYQFSSNEDLKYVKWLESNAEKFHFKISYPKGNPFYDYEPWHIRWRP